MSNNIIGAEGIVVHNGNIVLGLQTPKRWYPLADGKVGAIIKTIGGSLEETDENDSKKAIIREVLEEIKGITKEDIMIREVPIFKKEIKMGELNPYEKDSNLAMSAHFYFLELASIKSIMPRDLPALLEIPIHEFLAVELNKKQKLKNLEKYIRKNDTLELNLPEQYAFLIPEEVKDFLYQRGDEKYKEDSI